MGDARSEFGYSELGWSGGYYLKNTHRKIEFRIGGGG